jgi:hypothetical protein
MLLKMGQEKLKMEIILKRPHLSSVMSPYHLSFSSLYVCSRASVGTHVKSQELTACSVGWWLMAGAGLF